MWRGLLFIGVSHSGVYQKYMFTIEDAIMKLL